ncbi:MAG: glutamate synthase large subunit, partial [Pseudomonadota bacterium]
FGNGMSGGFAYQYDVHRRFDGFVSHDSVLVHTLADDHPQAEIHRAMAYQMLTWHVEATRSLRARELLKNWAEEMQHIRWIMPRALLQYQDAEAILAAKSRKDLIDELATVLANHQIKRLKDSWKEGEPVFSGEVPDYGETDTEGMFRLLNTWTVLETAQTIARNRIGGKDHDPRNRKAVRNLILTEDFALMSDLARHARAAVGDYEDADLASLIANKRVDDFKLALTLRDVRSMDCPATYGWIFHQSTKNREQLGRIPSFEELFARNAMMEVVTRVAAE